MDSTLKPNQIHGIKEWLEAKDLGDLDGPNYGRSTARLALVYIEELEEKAWAYDQLCK
jgi:hypothetical protein